MISFRNLSLRRGGHLLLSDVDATLYPGWRIGVVGRNGSGKSSLFAAIAGELDVDRGSIDLPTALRMASVAQETPALPEAAVDFVLGGDPALAEALAAERDAELRGDAEAQAAAHHQLDHLRGYDGPARAARLLHGLGFPAATHLQAVATFSGGWRMRLNLARALMAPSDLLLLDEPTNHLDLDAVLWLEDWLLRYEGTLLVISHDREFLDGVCTHTLHLHDGSARLYSGDYTSFERQRAEHLRQQQIAHEREQAVRAHLQSFVDRFRAKATKAKQAQSRLKRIEKLAGTEAVRAESPFRFAFATPPKLPSPLLRLDGVVAGYPPVDPRGEPSVILREVRFALEPGDRVALLGPNGAGKSTLVKTIAGELAVLGGERLLHGDARIGYFTQHTVDTLTAGESPIDHLARIAPGRGEQVWRNWLGQWNFAGERVFDPVDGFSG
ncbi:MAG TPA: ABC-F family ATP-binding cassette domain-containing protein, partial [Xanthomonadaceae bacterium]|nr:ABC-F family ATP-binding cassette domain-containing protein [Xanthomonadaceae bacterium]